MTQIDFKKLNLETKGALVLKALKKGDRFVVSGTAYDVLWHTPKTIRMRSKRKTLTIKKIREWNTGNHAVMDFFREIESVLVVDAINANNPLHQKSAVSTLAEKMFLKMELNHVQTTFNGALPDGLGVGAAGRPQRRRPRGSGRPVHLICGVAHD